MEMREKLEEAKSVLQKLAPRFPQTCLVLGSGLGSVAKNIRIEAEVPFSEIPHMRPASVIGHQGKLIFGTLEKIPVLCFMGRLHFYEGLSMAEVVFPFRAVALAGADLFVLTNAAGGVHPDMKPMDLVLIRDHINLMGTNPLIGPNDPKLGERFPDMTDLYDRKLRDSARALAAKQGLPLREGVYVGLHGPSYETPAEIEFYKKMGGDVVGMSTVPEAIALRHMKRRVVGISCVTNLAAGVGGQMLDHTEVLEAGRQVGDRFGKFLAAWLVQLQSEGVIR